MFKSMMLAGTVALCAVALAPAAQAKTNFSVHLGVPFYGYQVGPGWEYYEGYGWYDPGRYGRFNRQRERMGSIGNRLSCNQARRLVSQQGFSRVQAVECQGRSYTFSARRNGNHYTVSVDSRTGDVSRD